MWVRIALGIAVAISLTSCACSWTAVEPPLPPPSNAKNVPIVIAVKDIAAETHLTADMISVQNFSEDQAPPFAYHAPQLVIGKYAVVPIHANEAITDNIISSRPMIVVPR
jgi:Flp pilus assembly protein CpaB